MPLQRPRAASASMTALPSPARRQWLATTLPLLGAGLAVALLPVGSRAATNTPTPLGSVERPQLRLLPGLGGPHASQRLCREGACHRQQRRACPPGTAAKTGFVPHRAGGRLPGGRPRARQRCAQAAAAKAQGPGPGRAGHARGSPGMDGAVYGDRRDPYDVLLVAHDGSTRIFNSYNKKAST